MEIRELIEIIRNDVANTRKQGRDVIGIDVLLAYLNDLENQVEADAEGVHKFSLERFRAAHQAALAQWEKAHESRMETYRFMIAAGQSAMKATILINGGAAVALLAFIGHLVATVQRALVPEFAIPLTCFVAAILCGVLSVGLTYVTLSSYNADKITLGNITNWISVGFVFLSYVLFGVGSWLAYQGFLLLGA